MINLSNFRCRLRSKVDKVCKMHTFFFNRWIYRPIYLSVGIWYPTRSCNGHGTLMINAGQRFKFAISNSVPVFTLASALKTLHDTVGHHRTDIAEFGPMSTVFVHNGTIISGSCYNEPRFVFCYRAETGKIVPIVSITALPISRALAKLGFLGRIRHNTF